MRQLSRRALFECTHDPWSLRWGDDHEGFASVRLQNHLRRCRREVGDGLQDAVSTAGFAINPQPDGLMPCSPVLKITVCSDRFGKCSTLLDSSRNFQNEDLTHSD